MSLKGSARRTVSDDAMALTCPPLDHFKAVQAILTAGVEMGLYNVKRIPGTNKFVVETVDPNAK